MAFKRASFVSNVSYDDCFIKIRIESIESTECEIDLHSGYTALVWADGIDEYYNQSKHHLFTNSTSYYGNEGRHYY